MLSSSVNIPKEPYHSYTFELLVYIFLPVVLFIISFVKKQFVEEFDDYYDTRYQKKNTYVGKHEKKPYRGKHEKS